MDDLDFVFCPLDRWAKPFQRGSELPRFRQDRTQQKSASLCGCRFNLSSISWNVNTVYHRITTKSSRTKNGFRRAT